MTPGTCRRPGNVAFSTHTVATGLGNVPAVTRPPWAAATRACPASTSGCSASADLRTPSSVHSRSTCGGAVCALAPEAHRVAMMKDTARPGRHRKVKTSLLHD